MKIIIKNESNFVWTCENVKKVTIYNQNNEEENNMVVIEGWFEDVPNGYFVQSFDVNNFDRITLEEE